MNSQIVAYVLILIGVMIRMLIPALRKAKEAVDAKKQFNWNHKYTITACLSIVIGVATAAIGFEMFSVPEAFDFALVIGAIVYGFGLDSVIIEVAEWA